MFIATLAGRPVTFVEGEVVDIARASGLIDAHRSLDLWERWDDVLAWGQRAGAAQGPRVTPSNLGPPVPTPRQVFGVGLNYAAHAQEAGRAAPAVPSVFSKFSSCIVGPSDGVTVSSSTTDWEVELVAVIGRRADHVPAGHGWDCLAGLTIGQDLSDRALQVLGTPPQPSLGKSRPGYGPIGPWMVSRDEFGQPLDLAISCEVDGELMQSARTSDQTLSPSELIEWLSTLCTLLPGDLIFTGTPEGIGHTRNPPRYLRAGQTVRSSIEGIGVLATRLT